MRFLTWNTASTACAWVLCERSFIRAKLAHHVLTMLFGSYAVLFSSFA